MRSLVLGGAGFIGSFLVDRLVEEGPVTVYDNLSRGKRESLASHLDGDRIRFIEGDILDLVALIRAMAENDVVFHLAGPPPGHTSVDAMRQHLDQGMVGTYNVLEAMRRSRVHRVVFPSSAAVYGDTAEPRGELDLGHLPISLYGASKLASEALISAYAESFGLHAWIFRLPNVVGPRVGHTLAAEWLGRLKRTNGARLEIAGDGQRAKPYLHVGDCVAGMIFGLRNAASSADLFTPSGTLREVNQIARGEGEIKSRVHAFNLSPPDATSERRIAELCVAASPFRKAEIRSTGTDVPPNGEVAQSRLKPDKLAALGYRVSHTSEQAIQVAVEAACREVFV